MTKGRYNFNSEYDKHGTKGHYYLCTAIFRLTKLRCDKNPTVSNVSILRYLVLLVSYFISVVYFSIYHLKEIVINDPLYQCIGNATGHTPETGMTKKINAITF